LFTHFTVVVLGVLEAYNSGQKTAYTYVGSTLSKELLALPTAEGT